MSALDENKFGLIRLLIRPKPNVPDVMQYCVQILFYLTVRLVLIKFDSIFNLIVLSVFKFGLKQTPLSTKM